MALAKSELGHKIVIGPLDKTINSFLKDALPGSELNIIGENSAEMTLVKDTSIVIEEATAQATHHLVNKLSRSAVIFKKGLTSFPVVRTLKLAPKPR